jgi:HEPN domain-containing protein
LSSEAEDWLRYAEENRLLADMARSSGLLNPCIQNAQQAAEKALKGCCLAAGLPLKRTHSIQELRRDLRHPGSEFDLSDEEAELLDSIYLPSNYPLGSALPQFEVDVSLADRCVSIADRVLSFARNAIRSR